MELAPKDQTAAMARKAEKQEGKLVAVEKAGETSPLRPDFSNYVLLTRITGEQGDDVTLTFMHIFPLPAPPGRESAMRGEPVARIQLPYEIAMKVRDLFVRQLGLTHEELDAITGNQQGSKRRGRRKST